MANLINGPYLVGCPVTSARIWCLLDAPGNVEIRIADDGPSASENAVDDYISTGAMCQVEVSNLSPATRYGYTVWVDGSLASGPHFFWTMPAPGGTERFSLFFEMDMHGGFQHYGPLGRLYQRPANSGFPVLNVIVGDYELPVGQFDDRILRNDGQMGYARNVSLFPDKADVRKWLPYVYQVDDHDACQNNRAGIENPGRVTVLNQSMRDLNHGDYAVSDALYQAYRIGNVLLVMLDSRSFRTGCPGSIPEVPTESWDKDSAEYLGATQLAWLKSTLETHSDATFKLLCDGGTWLDNIVEPTKFAQARRDSVGIYYRSERNKFLAWLKTKPAILKGLILLTGDDHVPLVRSASVWRAQYQVHDETLDQAAVAVDKLTLFEVKPTSCGGPHYAENLNEEWANHPGEVFKPDLTTDSEFGEPKNADQFCMILEFDGLRSVTGTFYRWNDDTDHGFEYEPRPEYRFHGTQGTWTFPEYHEEDSLTAPGSPSSEWTQDPTP